MMGCFSFRCIECGRGIRSSSFSGEKCRLYLLKDGKVLQEMRGEYNSYGSIFIDGTQCKDVSHDLRESQEWINPETGIVDEDAWGEVCNLMFNDHLPIEKINFMSGIAAVHEHCFKAVPTIRSANDPNQGWGDGGEEECESEDGEYAYFGSLQGEGHEYKPLKPVEGYDVLKNHWKDYLKEKLWRAKKDLEFEKIFMQRTNELLKQKGKVVHDEPEVWGNQQKIDTILAKANELDIDLGG